jgi:Domain of unknown function (DUF4403)
VKNLSFLLPVALLAFFATSCKTLQIEKPKESYLPANIAPAVSELPLQVEVDVKKLEMAINKKMTGIIFDGSNIGGQDLSVKVSKAQNFTFTVKNNVIEYRIPLKVSTRFAWKVEKFGVTVGDYYDANGSIALSYKTTINFDKNWKLAAKTAPAGFEWIETPKVNIMGVNVPMKPIADFALARCEKLITDNIDKVLYEAVDVKKYATLAWEEIQKPRQVSAENNLWIRVTPKEILITPFSTIGNKLNISLALYAQIESFLGSQPAANPNSTLPALKTAAQAPEQFNLNLATDATFEKITEIAKKELVNKTFNDGNKTVTITDLSVFGSAGKVIFVIDIKGSLKGRLYFTGNISYNPEKMTIEITNPEFDINTSNALAKTASWLLHGMILKSISPYLSYCVKDNLEKMKADANNLLSNYKLTDGVNLEGKISSIKVIDLSLVPGAFRLQANVKGNAALKVSDLNF